MIEEIAFYPNPYSGGEASLTFLLSQPADEALLEIYTASGRRVLKKKQRDVPGDSYISFIFDEKDLDWRKMSNGVYFYSLEIYRSTVLLDRAVGKFAVLK